MIGPVYSLELHHALRRGWLHLGRWAYGALLLIEVGILFYLLLVQSLVQRDSFFAQREKTAELIESFQILLLGQHFAMVALATPALAAGSITDEKIRGTLVYLLGTSLTSRQIVGGKWLGQMVHVLILALTALPVFCLLCFLRGSGPLPVLVVVAVTIQLVAALAAAGVLASVWCRRTTTAILSLYAVGATGLAIAWYAGAAPFFDPIRVLQSAWQAGSAAQAGGHLLRGTVGWGGVTLVCLSLAVWRLRPAYMHQLEARNPRRRFRWRWLERPPVSDLPVRWKERYAGELASLPGLRLVPRRVWLVGVVALTILSSIVILWAHLPPLVGWNVIGPALDELDLQRLYWIYSHSRPAGDAFFIQGLVVLGIAALVVGVRASGSVTGERERQTWEGLLLTPLSAKQLVRGKAWGIIDSARPYLFAYTIPAVTLSLLGGWLAFYWTLYFWAMTWVAMYFMAGTGVEASVRCTTPWRSLLATFGSAGRGIFSRFMLIGIALGFGLGCLGSLLAAAMLGMGPFAGGVKAVSASLGCLFVAAMVFSQGELLLTRGETRIDQRERIVQEGARSPLPAKRQTALYRLGRLMGGSAKKKR